MYIIIFAILGILVGIIILCVSIGFIMLLAAQDSDCSSCKYKTVCLAKDTKSECEHYEQE